MTTPYAGVDFISPVRIDEFGCWIMYTKKAMTTEFYLDRELALNPFIFIKKNGRDILLTVFTDLKRMN
jgi:hypothetical protein